MFLRTFHRHWAHRAAHDEFGHGLFGHHRRRGRRHGGRGRDGAGRVFDHGDIRLVIMALLAEKPRYGYELIKAIEDLVGGGYSPSPGVVYPTLTMLEEVGHASVTAGDGGRKLYALTPEGLAYLDANRTLTDAIFARLKEGGESHQEPPISIMEALHDLHHAIRRRVRDMPAGADKAQAIAELIERAARAIEEV